MELVLIMGHLIITIFVVSIMQISFYANGQLLYPESPPSCFITGVDELEAEHNVQIYPNPFRTTITIEDKESKLKEYTISVVSG